MEGQLTRVRSSYPKGKVDKNKRKISKYGVDTGGRLTPDEVAGARLYLLLKYLRKEISREELDYFRDVLGLVPGTRWYGSVSSSDKVDT